MKFGILKKGYYNLLGQELIENSKTGDTNTKLFYFDKTNIPIFSLNGVLLKGICADDTFVWAKNVKSNKEFIYNRKNLKYIKAEVI